MSDLERLISQGGSVMIALIILSLLLYERCFDLLLLMHQAARKLRSLNYKAVGDLNSLRHFQDQLMGTFERNMIRIRTMVAAAPLLGLLGTVIGMVETFTSLSNRSGEHTIQGLSDGISKALITTETGLAIAIPAVIILYFAQRQLNDAVRILIEKEDFVSGESAT